MTTRKFGPWQIWNGGECPVDDDTKVQFRFRCENRNAAERRLPQSGRGERWSHWHTVFDIIAYRVLLEPKRETVESRDPLVDKVNSTHRRMQKRKLAYDRAKAKWQMAINELMESVKRGEGNSNDHP